MPWSTLAGIVHGGRGTRPSPCYRAGTVWPKLLRLGNSERHKKVWEDGLQSAAQPNIEEIRQVRIINIVIVWWIFAEAKAFLGMDNPRVPLHSERFSKWRSDFELAAHGIRAGQDITAGLTKWIAFSKVEHLPRMQSRSALSFGNRDVRLAVC